VRAHTLSLWCEQGWKKVNRPGKPRRKPHAFQNQSRHQPFAPNMNLEGVEKLLNERSGSVLARDTIIKSDQYVPSTYLETSRFEQILLSGAPNFRRLPVPSTNVILYGVGQPTVYGIRGVLNLIRCACIFHFSRFKIHSPTFGTHIPFFQMTTHFTLQVDSSTYARRRRGQTTQKPLDFNFRA
jgi:hypothetical protein